MVHSLTLVIAVAVRAVKLRVADTDVCATQAIAQWRLAYTAPKTGKMVEQLKALYDHGSTMTCNEIGNLLLARNFQIL